MQCAFFCGQAVLLDENEKPVDVVLVGNITNAANGTGNFSSLEVHAQGMYKLRHQQVDIIQGMYWSEIWSCLGMRCSGAVASSDIDLRCGYYCCTRGGLSIR